MKQDKHDRTLRKTDGHILSMRAQARRSIDWITAKYLNLSEELRKTSNLEDALTVVAYVAMQLTRSRQADLRILDEDGQHLTEIARTGNAVFRPQNSWERSQGDPWINQVLKNGKPLIRNAPRMDGDPTPRALQSSDVSILAVPLLTSQDCIGVLSVLSSNGVNYSLRDLNLLRLLGQISVPYLEITRLKRINESDPLTLLQNRRHLQERLPAEIKAAHRENKPLTIAMLDLDRFKRINDTHGHKVGDEVLRELAKRLRQSCRCMDILVRWGGEEFVAIFPDATRGQAYTIAERIRKTVADTPFDTSAGQLAVTISLGIADCRSDDNSTSLLRRADQALYLAKQEGRNRVVCSPASQ